MIPRKTTVTTQRTAVLSPLFEELWIPPLIRPVLYGEMGLACVDRADAPTVCCLALSDFVMFAGDASGPAARYFVTTTARPCYVLPSESGWMRLVRTEVGAAVPRIRYSFSSQSLERAGLRAAYAAVSEGFELRRFDAAAVDQAAGLEWSRSLVENFPSTSLFLERGVGYGIFEGDRLVAGAASFAIYRDVLEIEVDTHPAYRRRGLALAASARLIEHCLDLGIVPHWDAANEASRSLAEKLGFTLERRYDVLEV